MARLFYVHVVFFLLVLELVASQDYHDDEDSRVKQSHRVKGRPIRPPRPPSFEQFYNQSSLLHQHQQVGKPSKAPSQYGELIIPPQDDGPTRRPNGTRIVGGHLAYIRNYPWQVAIIEDNYFSCGGSIITNRWILTAAHCISPGARYAIRAGSWYFGKGGQVRRVSKVVRHAKYNSNTMDNDIAVMKLNRVLNLNPHVQKVLLPQPSTKTPYQLKTSGWGTLSSGSSNPSKRLRAVAIHAVLRTDCQRMYRKAQIAISKKMICAAAPGKDSCQGDSGGALMHNNVQFGIVSFGVGCGNKNFPGVYTNVKLYRDFIKVALAKY